MDGQVSDTCSPEGDPEERPIRWQLVERIRREIAEGTYETRDRWEQALEKLFRCLEER